MMRRTSFFLTIEQRLYSILLIFCISLSVISIIGNLVAGFPLYLSIKWLLLVAAASASVIVDRIKSEAAEGMLFFYLFLVAL